MAKDEGIKTEAARRILDCASELFAEKGYERATLREVADRAGVAKGLAFHHFGSKDALLDRVLTEYYDRLRATVLAAAAQADSPRGKVREMMAAYFRFARENDSHQRMVWSVTAHHSDAKELVTERIKPVFEGIHEVIKSIVPKTGVMATHHLYMTLSGAVITYFTLGPLLEPVLPHPYDSDAAVDEREAHLIAVVDAIFDAAEKARDAEAGA